jgi:iron-sulfur cluster assembly protein
LVDRRTRTFGPSRCLIEVDTLTVTLSEGEVLLHGLLESGAALGHDCGGKLACATCCVIVRHGADTLSPPSDEELDMLERAGAAQEGARLSCQTTGSGEITVDVPRAEAPSHEHMLPIELTADAAQFLAVQLGKHPGCIAVRLAVAPAGCSGLRYRVDPVNSVDERDVAFECGGVRIAVDAASLPFIQGTTVRLVQEGLARRLRFDNPNARQSCGCGESFAR